jgi:hypothetical protein
MKRAARRTAAAALLALAACGRAQAQAIAVPDSLRQLGVETWWDVVQFEPWSASLGLSFDEQQQRLSSPDAPTQRSSTRLTTESFSIRNDGISVIDRRLFTASLGLGFMFNQEHQKSDDAAITESGRLTNYSFSGSFLPDSAYSTTLSAQRNQSLYVLPSGTTTKSDYEGKLLRVNLREDNIAREKEWLSYLSGGLRVADQRERQTTTSGTQTFRQDDRRQSATVDVHNGGLNSDLSLQYQYTRLDNYAYEAGSYSSNTANVSHSIDFCATLNCRLDSHFNYYSRSGASLDSDQKSLELSEFLTIDHNVARSSTYTYLLTRQDTQFGATTTHSGSAQVNQQVYNNLSVSAAANGIYFMLPGGTSKTLGANASFDYRRRLPWEGQLHLSGGSGYSRTSNDVPGGDVQVVDEPYAVPANVGAGSAILLRNRNIGTTTIVVVVLKGGARVPAFEGVDYTIRVDGDQTSLVPSPASAVMLPGDPLNVSYTYAIPPESTYANTSRSLATSVDWSWIGFSASHEESDQKALSGSSDFLLDQRRDVGQVYVSGEWQWVSARVTATATDYDSTRLSFRENRLAQYVSYVPSPGLLLTFSADQYRTHFRLPEHTTTGSTYRLDLQWYRGAWITSGYASHRTYDDSEQPRETVDEAGVRVRRTWTLLDFSFAFGLQKRVRGAIGNDNAFIHMNVVRKF